jgi:hypothetical protein
MEQGRPSLRSSYGGRNGTATQLVGQETVATDGDGTRASARGTVAHQKLRHERRWRSSGTAGLVRLLQLALSSTQIKEGSSVEARTSKKAGGGVRALLPRTEAKNGAAVLELGPAARCSKWGKWIVARGMGCGGGGVRHLGDLKASTGGTTEHNEAQQ